MRAWLVTVGEPLPNDGTGERLLRSGLLADTLAKRGHEVDFWTSTFDHTAKKSRAQDSQVVAIESNYRVRMLHGDAYQKNISLARLRHHYQIAKAFREAIRSAEKPDVIISSMPLWELCDAATAYGLRHDIPTLVDIRDMWPDAIVDLAPTLLRPLVKAAAFPAYRSFHRAIRQATGVTGMTESAVQWALDSACKKRGMHDRAFPFGYRHREPSAADKQAGYEFWQQFSLTPASNDFTLCFFGAIGPHFDIDTLLGASKILQQSGKAVRFVLCGTGDHWDQWRAKAANDAQIVLPGWVNASKIWTLMQMSSAGIAPYYSSWDFQLSLPNKPIEYLSGGLPVVSSLHGELQRLLDENECGATYTNGQPQQLASLIEGWIDNPDQHAAMRERAKSLYLRRFVAEKVYSDFSDFLEELAKGRSGAANSSAKRVLPDQDRSRAA